MGKRDFCRGVAKEYCPLENRIETGYPYAMFEDFPIANDNLNPDQSAIYWERLRAMSPQERWTRTIKLSKAAKDFLLAGILYRHPGIEREELRLRYAATVLGRDFTVRYYNWDPKIQGY